MSSGAGAKRIRGQLSRPSCGVTPAARRTGTCGRPMVNGTCFRDDPVMRDMVYMVPGTLLPVKVPCSVVNSTAKTAETS